MKRINRDTVVALFLLVLTGVFFTASFEIPDMGYESLRSNVWPQMILAVLALFSLIYLVRSISAPETYRDEGDRPEGNWFAAHRNPILCFVAYTVFLLTLDWLGMLIGGILFVFALLTLIGDRDPRSLALHAVLGVVMIGAMWAVFTFGLGVILPEGEILTGF